MKIAGKICIYTNENFTVEELSGTDHPSPPTPGGPGTPKTASSQQA